MTLQELPTIQAIINKDRRTSLRLVRAQSPEEERLKKA